MSAKSGKETGTMKINLSAEAGKIVERELETGEHKDADDFVGEAVFLYDRMKKQLIERLEKGSKDAEEGRVTRINSREDFYALFDDIGK